MSNKTNKTNLKNTVMRKISTFLAVIGMIVISSCEDHRALDLMVLTGKMD
jgi:hypothetical protein